MHPVASISSAPSRASAGPTAAMRPSRIPTSATRLVPVSGSITVPPCTTRSNVGVIMPVRIASPIRYRESRSPAHTSYPGSQVELAGGHSGPWNRQATSPPHGHVRFAWPTRMPRLQPSSQPRHHPSTGKFPIRGCIAGSTSKKRARMLAEQSGTHPIDIPGIRAPGLPFRARLGWRPKTGRTTAD